MILDTPPTVASPEPSIYPYRAGGLVPARGALVFAPHPDDEVLGCGGLLALLLDAEVPVQVVVVSDGGQGGDPQTRERESVAAARALSAPNAALQPKFWRLPDRGLVADDALIDRMRMAIADSGADWVLAPSPFEIHPDHRAVAVAAALAFTSTCDEDSDSRLAFYEVGHPLFANLLIDISPVLSRKEAAIRCFLSQLATQAYGDQALGLNRFRSYTLGSLVTHAEAYQVLERVHLRHGLGAFLHDCAARVALRLGVPA